MMEPVGQQVVHYKNFTLIGLDVAINCQVAIRGKSSSCPDTQIAIDRAIIYNIELSIRLDLHVAGHRHIVQSAVYRHDEIAVDRGIGNWVWQQIVSAARAVGSAASMIPNPSSAVAKCFIVFLPRVIPPRSAPERVPRCRISPLFTLLGAELNRKITCRAPSLPKTLVRMPASHLSRPLPHLSRRAALGQPADRNPTRRSSDFSSYQARSLP